MGFDLTTGIDLLWRAIPAIRQRLCPDNIAIAFYHRVCASKFKRFLGIKRGMNPAKDNVRAPAPCDLPNLITAQRIDGVNADSDHVTGMKALRLHLG